MDRPLRAIRPIASPVEGRLLLTSMPALPPLPAPALTPVTAPAITPMVSYVSFVGAKSDVFSLRLR